MDRKIVQAKLRKELKEGKRKYKTKIENLFKSKNVAVTWKGLKTLTGENSHGQSQSSMTTGERRTFSNNLNDFFCRYENVDHNLNMSDLINRTSGQSPYDGFTINKEDVKMVFTKVNVRKSVGPDGICSKLLKVCAPQLCQVFSTLFTWSLKDCIVPGLWKTSMICPIPKNNSPSDLSDYRPIAITSVVMKCFEKIVLHHLLDLTKGMQDPFQFAYKPNRSIEDAILTLLHNTFLHTNNPKSYVRILFADFSSAFNTIKPYHLAKKLVRLNISPKLVIWIINFLSHRKQFVRFKGVLSGERSISTGVPQGCVLSPVLFTLYTNDCTGTENTIFIKYSDDTAIVDLSNSIPHYIEEVDRFTTWCKANFLDLNVAKTKELLIDFRKQPPAVSPITIDGEIVERVEKYKYLGIILDNKLKFDSNVLNIYKKCHYRIYCLQRLRNIGINSKILALYYQSCVETLVTSCLICWYGSVNLRSKKLLNNIVKACSKTVGIEHKSLHNIFNNSVKKRQK